MFQAAVRQYLRVVVVSNALWKIQVWVRSERADSSTTLQVRSHGGVYLTLSSQQQILVHGLNGVFEISIDYRLPLGSDGDLEAQAPEEVVYTIMSD